MGAQQVVVQQVDELLGAVLRAVRHADAEFLADGLQEIQRREPRIDDQGDFRVLGRARQQRADRGGLAGADLAGQLDEAAGFIDAVDQVRQRIGMVAAQVQVTRVRRDRKGFFGDAEEGEVHVRRVVLVAALMASMAHGAAGGTVGLRMQNSPGANSSTLMISMTRRS